MSTTIGIIGCGRFGRLMVRYLSEDFDIFAYDPDPKSAAEAAPRVRPSTFKDACRQDIVVAAVPISAFKEVLVQMAPHVSEKTIVADVCSVKVYPARWMKEILPPNVSILATHPMFGPDSAANSLQGCKIVLCPERIRPEAYRKIRAYLQGKKLETIETTPHDHDRQIAVTLGLTHFIGRSLSEFGVKPLPVDTEGYKRLLHILGVVENDTWQLFLDMHRYNPYARECRTAFLEAARKIESLIVDS